MSGPLKVVVIGNIGAGKTLLAGALAQQLDVPFVGLDDCRCREGDGSAAGEASAWAAFLTAAGDPASAVLECTGTGPFAPLLRQALARSRARTVFLWLRAPLSVCRRRVEGRTWRTPYPDFGVPMDRVQEQVEVGLLADLASERSWPGPVVELDATRPAADLVRQALRELDQHEPATAREARLGVAQYQAPWRRSSVSPCRTHHVVDGAPLYMARFEATMSFHPPGLAPVLATDGWCHIEATGRPVYSQRYRQAFGFYEGHAAVVDESGWFHVGADGQPATTARYAWAGNFQGGRATVRFDDGHYAHVRPDGTPAYPARYRYAGDFREGFAVVMDTEGRHFHVDPDGVHVRERTFDDLDVFHKGHARARDTRGWFHVDRSGDSVYDRRFATVEPFYNGQARVERGDGGLEVIDEEGSPIVELRRGRRTPLQRLSSDLVGFWRTQTIKAAVEVGVFEALPGDAESIAGATELAAPIAARLLRALWELGLVSRDASERWSASEAGALLVRSTGTGMDDAARIWGGDHSRRWLDVVPALRSGDARDGPTFFEALVGEDLERYHHAIDGYARNDYVALPDAVDWTRHRRVLDAGGGRGALLVGLLSRHRALTGCLLDLPEVVASATLPVALADRIQAVGTDLFQPWPERGDAIVLARVLHDWSDADAVRLLARARAATEPGGRVYVLELVLRDDSPGGGLLDINMLVMTGGRERTEADFRSIFEAAGLRLVGTQSLPSVSSILIGEAS